jgi:hypothetical protein
MVINHCSNVAMKFTRVGQISKFLSPDAVSSSRLTRESSAVCIPNTAEIVTRTDCERSSVSKRWGDAKPVSQSVGSKMGTLENTLEKTEISRFKTKMGTLENTLKNTLKKTTFCNTLPMILIGYGNHRMT